MSYSPGSNNMSIQFFKKKKEKLFSLILFDKRDRRTIHRWFEFEALILNSNTKQKQKNDINKKNSYFLKNKYINNM